MTRRTVPVWTIFSIFAVLGCPAIGAADPVRVTGGELVMTGAVGSMDLTGERGFSLSARVSAFSGVFSPLSDCVMTPECTPGTVVSLHAYWSGFDIRSGLLTFEGESYQVTENDEGASVAVDLSGSFVAPPFGSSAVITAPFRLELPSRSNSGSLFFLPHPKNPSPTFLTGAGTATVTLSPWGAEFPGSWTVDAVRYEFAPVPEPGTILTVGVGIAGIARRMRRRSTYRRLSITSSSACRPGLTRSRGRVASGSSTRLSNVRKSSLSGST